MRQQALFCPIGKPQALAVIKREDRDVNLHHHFTEQGSRFQRTAPLLAQSFTERIHLALDVAQNIASSRPACPNRVVALTKRNKLIGEGLQRNTARHRTAKADPNQIAAMNRTKVHCSLAL